MQLTRKKLSEIKPYERNPRNLAGHTRYKALKKLGLEDG